MGPRALNRRPEIDLEMENPSMSTANLFIVRQVRPEQVSEAPYAWVIVAIATTCLALGFGANIIISVFMKPLEEEFGWLRADTSMAYTMNAIGAGARGNFVGWPVGPGRTKTHRRVRRRRAVARTSRHALAE